ncbi:phosphopantetheine-binding protein [Dyella sp. Tek66A03]|uniref:phosphopantetheine-binding protein n=1 Tax=Dyella sp. Tek66A03 TaxID=3458298 RepID=UPI00403EA56E
MAALVAEQQCSPSQTVGPQTRLAEDLHMDSLEMQGLLLTIEECYGVVPKEDQLADITNVADLHAATLRWIANAGRSS